MARVRAKGGAAAGEPKRRITAPVSEGLFRRVGAYTKYSGRQLGDVVEDALTKYLAEKRFSIGSAAEPGDDQAAA